MRRQRLMAGTALATVALLIGAGCGGDDDAASGAGQSTDDGGGGGSESGGGGNGGAGGDAFCGDLEGAMAGSTGLSTSVLGSGDPESLSDAIDTALEEWPERMAVVEGAPPEIAEDLATVLDATHAMFEALAEADPSNPEEMGAAMASVPMGPEVQAASTRLAEYFQEHCGGALASGG